MGNVLRMIFGISESKPKTKTKNFKIRPKMINPDVVVMDIDSFRKSITVQNQAKAAKSAVQTSD